jgi:hypothetical protein
MRMLRTKRVAAPLLGAGLTAGAHLTKTPKGRVRSQSRKPGRTYAATTMNDVGVSLDKP